MAGDYRRFRRRGGTPASVTATPASPAHPSGKIGVLIAVASEDGFVRWSIARQWAAAIEYNHTPECPFHFEEYVVNGARPVEFARNTAVEHFVHATKCEWLMFWDADQEIPENWAAQLMVDGCDIISGTTFCWVGNEQVGSRLRFNQYALDEKGQCFNILPFSDSIPYEVPIAGTACMAIRRRVFEKLGCWPFQVQKYANGRYRTGEDVAFCASASQAGFKVAYHPGVVYGHVKSIDLLHVAEFVSEKTRRVKGGIVDTPKEVLSV